ncbi:MAG: 4Fe-4S binding protein [Methanobacteriota archaeon]
MRKYKLTYPSEKLGDALLSEAILKTGAKVNILRANVDYDRGILVVSVLADGRKEKDFIGFLRKNKIAVEELSGKIFKDDGLCTDCGLCVGVCPTEAITTVDCVIEINNDECVQCNACVEACPFLAIRIQEF